MVEGMSIRETSRAFGLHRDILRGVLTQSATKLNRIENPHVEARPRSVTEGRLLFTSSIASARLACNGGLA